MACHVAALFLGLLFVMDCGCALRILKPTEDEFLVAPHGTAALEYSAAIDLEDFVVPTKGVVSIFLDGAHLTTLCPQHSGHIDDCPVEGEPMAGVRTIRLVDLKPGLHSLVVHAVDFESLKVLEQASVSFLVRSEDAADGLFGVGGGEHGPQFNMMAFSKNRACQLDLLLRSMKEMAPGWKDQNFKVLMAHDEKFKEGYRRLKRAHPDVNLVLQSDAGATFKDAVLAELDPTVPYTMFFVDDQVFTAPFGFMNDTAVKTLAANPMIMTASLRMHPGTSYCYPSDETVQRPHLSDDLVWDWRGAEGDWGYPMSVDAHIFRTKEILPLLARIDYRNPNEMEAHMHQHALPNPYMVCYPTPRVFNVPSNKVQRIYPNRFIHPHRGFSPESLETEFLMGRRLSMETLRGLAPRSPHVEIPLVFGVGARPRNKVGEAAGEELYAPDDPDLERIEEEERERAGAPHAG